MLDSPSQGAIRVISGRPVAGRRLAATARDDGPGRAGDDDDPERRNGDGQDAAPATSRFDRPDGLVFEGPLVAPARRRGPFWSLPTATASMAARYRRVAEAVAERADFDVIAVDFRGHGRSPGPARSGAKLR